MNKKIYVGNLPFNYGFKELTTLFEKFGEIQEALVIADKYNGRSKGFGFVQMANDADADNAINMFNGKELEGRSLTVNEARPMEPRAPRGNSRGEGRSNW